MPFAYVSIGSNVDKEIYVPASLRALERYFGDLLVSRVYENQPVGFDGEAFFNLVVGFASRLGARQIAAILRKLELAHGRTSRCHKFAPRTLDLDLILYGDQIIDEDGLRIPREDIQRYAFVLEPLAEIAPDLVHPVLKMSYRDMWAAFDKQGWERRLLPLAGLTIQTASAVDSNDLPGHILSVQC